MSDAADCAPGDAGVFAIPARIGGLDVSRMAEALLAWSDPASTAGSGTTSQVASALIGDLIVRRSADAACVATGLTRLSTTDSRMPGMGSAFYDLVRAVNACGPPAVTGWGRDSLGMPRRA